MSERDTLPVLHPVHRKKIQRIDIESLAGLSNSSTLARYLSHPQTAQQIDGWKEKLIKFVGTHRPQIGNVIASRFGKPSVATTIRDILFSLASTDGSNPELDPPDLRAINAVLWLEKIAPAHPHMADFLAKLPQMLRERSGSWRPNPVAIPSFETPAIVADSQLDAQTTLAEERNSGSSGPTIVLCPNHKSINTLTTLHQLQTIGVQVDHIFVRPLISLGRLKEELRFSPGFLLKRVLNELILTRFQLGSSDRANLNPFKQQIGCAWKKVAEAARDLNAKVHYFTNLNQPSCVKTLKELQPSYGVFTGGGILSAEMLQTFKAGVVHAHPGILPQYKGMDVAHWAILDGNLKYLGPTCQLMSPNLDAGVLLSNFLIDLDQFDSLLAVRTAIVSGKIGLVCNTLKSLIDGKIQPSEVPSKDGKLYFLMHPRLVKITTEYTTQLLTK